MASLTELVIIRETSHYNWLYENTGRDSLLMALHAEAEARGWRSG